MTSREQRQEQGGQGQGQDGSRKAIDSALSEEAGVHTTTQVLWSMKSNDGPYILWALDQRIKGHSQQYHNIRWGHLRPRDGDDTKVPKGGCHPADGKTQR